MDQINVFEILYEPYQIKTPIRLIELFAGIGSQAKALERLGMNFEHHKVVEFDKYAIQSYNAIHGTNFETSDITKIHAKDLEISKTDKFTYLLTYSFPCQDLSLAGKQKGMKKGSGTRSGLLWEVERLLDECIELNGNLPQVLLMENVPEVIGAKNIEHFHEWQRKLESLGYRNYCQVLNAKDYGIPQNRKRCFMVSVLGDYYYEFPKPFKLDLRLKDMLEDEVDKKYFLSDKLLKCFTDTTNRNGFVRGDRFKPHDLDSEYAYTITTNDGNRATDNFIIDAQKTDKTICLNPKGGRGGVEGLQPSLQDRIYDSEGIAPACTTSYMPNVAINHIGGVVIPEATKKGYKMAYEGDGVCKPITIIAGCRMDDNFIKVVGSVDIGNNESNNRVYSADGISPTLNTMQGGHRQPKILIPEATKKGYAEAKDGDGVYINRPHQKRGVVQNGMIQTLKTSCSDVEVVTNNLRIRKLTPLECFRLMGFDDEDFYKAEKVNSNTQLYKQAGNSIVVNVLEHIFKQLL